MQRTCALADVAYLSSWCLLREFFPHVAAEERVAQCDALLDLQNSTSEFQSFVNESLTVISSELESLETRLSQAEMDIDDLQGKA